MCMHVKEGKVKGAVPQELRLLRKAIVLAAEMSVVSNCLECIRMGRDGRYVSLEPLWDSPGPFIAICLLLSCFDVGFQTRLSEHRTLKGQFAIRAFGSTVRTTVRARLHKRKRA